MQQASDYSTFTRHSFASLHLQCIDTDDIQHGILGEHTLFDFATITREKITHFVKLQDCAFRKDHALVLVDRRLAAVTSVTRFL